MPREGAAAETRLGQLRERYGTFPVVEEHTVVPQEALVECMSNASDGSLGGARTLLERDGAALLVRYEDAPDVWDLPGGSLDRNEHHEQTARRHVADQLGIECELTGVFHARRQRFGLVDGGDGAEGLWIHFEGRPLETTLDSRSDIVEARWFDSPPAAVADDVRERLAAAVAAD